MFWLPFFVPTPLTTFIIKKEPMEIIIYIVASLMLGMLINSGITIGTCAYKAYKEVIKSKDL